MGISRSKFGVQVHHLIEQRFAATLGVNSNNMKSIVLTVEEHQAFTNAWRARIGYEGSNFKITTLNATPQQIYDAARYVYRDHPDILIALGL